MRKLTIGLVMVSLLAFAGQAGAQTGDPLGLISSAAIAPFWGSTGNVTVIQITSPVGSNIQGHAVFFNAACTRDESVPVPLTTNDVHVFTIDGGHGFGFNGLVVIASTLDEISLLPLENPIHVRARWSNLGSDFSREVDPISLQHAENLGLTWNPFRSAASFVAELDTPGFSHTLYLVCPSSAVTAAVPTSAGFPPAPVFAFSTNQNLISGRVYDWEEIPVRNIDINCQCLSAHPLASVSPIYTLVRTYTELVTYPNVVPTPDPPRTFVAYRGIIFATTAECTGGTPIHPCQGVETIDDFGRLPNASASSYAGSVILGFDPSGR